MHLECSLSNKSFLEQNIQRNMYLNCMDSELAHGKVERNVLDNMLGLTLDVRDHIKCLKLEMGFKQ